MPAEPTGAPPPTARGGSPLPVPWRTGSPSLAGTLSPFDAVVFDLDGVVTDTAAVHRIAWKQLFDAVLTDARIPAATAAAPFRDSDYLRYVDGRPREEGIQAFLQSRGVELPLGTPADPPGTWTAYGLGATKNDLFLDELHRNGVHVFPGTVDLIGRLRRSRVPVALVTSSRNAAAVLAAAGLDGVFDAVVDGRAAAELGLPGKPDPATFLEAARRLKVRPPRTAVVEDATAGIAAARSGGFGLVVGIDRAAQRRRLKEAGADLVLRDVSELDIGLVLTDPWRLVYEGFDPAQEGHREALTTLGNGRMATRGAAPESHDDTVHYPGTYLAGVYNRLPHLVDGAAAESEDMVNLPNWLPLDLRFGSGGWWSEGGLILRRARRELDLQRAVLTRRVLLEDPHGRQLEVTQRRFVSIVEPCLAQLETTLISRRWSGPVLIRTGIDGGIVNGNVPEDAAGGNRHLAVDAVGVRSGTETLEAVTVQSHIRVAAAVRVSFGGGTAGIRSSPLPTPTPSLPSPSPSRADGADAADAVDGADAADGADDDGGRSVWLQEHSAELTADVPLVICKTAALVSSRDRAVSSPLSGALAVLARTPEGFGPAFAEHEAAWRRFLELFRFDLHADRETQLVLNLHIFHLLQSLTPHTAEVDAGVPARGLHGEGYRGHIFWDDLFVLPLVTSRLPMVTRAVLDYRWRRLDAARDAAREAGLGGAMFPWRSGSDGTEETPRRLFNRFSGRWMSDNSRLQRHGGLAVAYNAWQYFQATADRDWLLGRGAEIIVEVARLFASLAEWDGRDGRFHLRGLMGPDEYHDGYPGQPGGGLDDNAYTNVMAAWVCSLPARIMETIRGLDRRNLQTRLGITAAELELWDRLGHLLAVPFHDGMISQFDGYGQLRELDWDRYRRTYGNIHRLDLILAAEGDSTNAYKLSKQADVLMLLYLLGEEQLVQCLHRMGYEVGAPEIARMVEYYLSRTAHGSTLSRVTHASVLAASDPERAWDSFRDALDADLDDTQGGTTRTGIHLGAMAGTIDVIQRSFAGLRMQANTLFFTPCLPAELGRVSFRVRYRGLLLDVSLSHSRLRVEAADGTAPPVRIQAGTRVRVLEAGSSIELDLPGSPQPPRTAKDIQ